MNPLVCMGNSSETLPMVQDLVWTSTNTLVHVNKSLVFPHVIYWIMWNSGNHKNIITVGWDLLSHLFSYIYSTEIHAYLQDATAVFQCSELAQCWLLEALQ